MNDVLQLRSVDVEQAVGGDDVNICEKERRVEPGIGDALLHVAPGHPDLVQQFAVLGDIGLRACRRLIASSTRSFSFSSSGLG